MRPELPYLAAGGIVLAGSAIKNKGTPDNMMLSVMGTAILVIVASATGGSRVAPLVHAIGILLVIGAVLRATGNIRPPVQSVKASQARVDKISKESDWIK